ncbi:MAG: NERD domain-containing protein [Blautia sp.]|nr:NERD domain-containing protein [Blautia sp.]
MEGLLSEAPSELKKDMEKQIKIAGYGMAGEQNIAFELKNSGMDMCILHDICLQSGELSAQIDYIVITRKYVYILECKNLIGNIEIDNAGNFIRTYELGGKKIKEGVYSPITQNERHMNIIKELRMEAKGNILSKKSFEKNFGNIYKSIVVLANPKTYLNAKYAKKEVKEKVIRADQLINYMKSMEAQSKNSDLSQKEMTELAQFFVDKNCEERSDYSLRYVKMFEDIRNSVKVQSEDKQLPEQEEHKNAETVGNKIEIGSQEDKHEELVRKLKEFRLQQSREEGVKAYYIFTDSQMEALISKKAKNKEELLTVSGFGAVKVEKYGDEIIKILNDAQK